MAEIPLADQIKAVESVVATRSRTHASFYSFMGASVGEAAASAVRTRIEAENKALEAALETLRSLESGEVSSREVGGSHG
jgi:hypothetical protein